MAVRKKPRKRAARPRKPDKAADKEPLIDHPLDRIKSFAAERQAVLHESSEADRAEPCEKTDQDKESPETTTRRNVRCRGFR
jgi:hypothetical protein